MKRRGIHIVLIVLLLGPLPVASEEAIVPLHLLIAEIKNHPEIEALRLRAEAVKEEIAQTQFLEDPQFSITQWGIPSNLNIGRAEETWFGIAQMFPFPGKRRLRSQLATSDWAARQQDNRVRRLALISEVKSAYYQLSLSQEKIRFHQKHQTLLEESIHIAKKRYAVGQGSQQDILKAEMERSGIHNELIALENERSILWAKMNTLINRSIETPLGKVEALTLRPFPLTYNALIEAALRAQPELQGAALMVERSQLATALTQKEADPDFMVEVQYWDVQGDENRWMVGGKMNLPFVFKEKYAGKNRKAAVEAQEAAARYTARKNETLLEVKSLFTTIQTTAQQLARYPSDLIPLANQSVQVAQIAYQAGTGDLLTLIEDIQLLLDIQIAYYEKLAMFWEQIAKLEPLIGEEIP